MPALCSPAAGRRPVPVAAPVEQLALALSVSEDRRPACADTPEAPPPRTQAAPSAPLRLEGPVAVALVRDAAAALVAILARWLSVPDDVLAPALPSDVAAHVTRVRAALGVVHPDLAHRLARAACPGEMTLALPGELAEGLRAVLRVAVRALIRGDGSAGAPAAGARQRSAVPADTAMAETYAALGGQIPLVSGAGGALSEPSLAAVAVAGERRNA